MPNFAVLLKGLKKIPMGPFSIHLQNTMVIPSATLVIRV